MQEQSYRLPPIRTHTLSSDSETEDERRLESTAAKLRRLKAELAQVEQEIAAGPSNPPKRTTTRRSVLPPRPAYDLAGELSGLKERLEAIEGHGGREHVQEEEDEWSERLERLKLGEPSTGRDIEEPRGGGDEATKTEPTYPITDLDKRLARLEAALGSDESNVSFLPFH